MCQWVLQLNGKIVPRRTLRRLTDDEASTFNEVELRKISAFDKEITKKLGDSITLGPTIQSNYRKTRKGGIQDPSIEDPTSVLDFDLETCVPYVDEEETSPFIPDSYMIDSTGKHLNQQSVADLLINSEVLLPLGERNQMAKIFRRAIGQDGNLVGT